MKRTDAQWQKLYANYKQKWETLNKKLPEGMADKMYSYLGYRNAYTFLEKTREAEVTAGKRKVLNTQRDLINDQRYRYSREQASAIKKALVQKELKKVDYSELSNKEFKALKKKIEKQFKVNEIRVRTDAAKEVYQIAKDMNKELKTKTYKEYDADGNLVEVPLFDSKARAKIISQTVFGSV